MVQEAEQFKDDDLKVQQKIEAKNKLETMLHGARSAVDGDDIQSKLTSDELETVETMKTEIKETEEWLLNDDLSSEDIEGKFEELNGKYNSILMKLMGQGTQMPEGMSPNPDQEDEGPQIDEVD